MTYIDATSSCPQIPLDPEYRAKVAAMQRVAESHGIDFESVVQQASANFQSPTITPCEPLSDADIKRLAEDDDAALSEWPTLHDLKINNAVATFTDAEVVKSINAQEDGKFYKAVSIPWWRRSAL